MYVQIAITSLQKTLPFHCLPEDKMRKDGTSSRPVVLQVLKPDFQNNCFKKFDSRLCNFVTMLHKIQYHSLLCINLGFSTYMGWVVCSKKILPKNNTQITKKLFL